MREKLIEIVAEVIDRVDHETRAPDGYADILHNDNISDWGAWLADHVLTALAEHGFDIVHNPLEAVKDMKTWPQDVRKAHGF